MTTPTWQVSGQYFETCSCDFVCPCILGQMAVEPTHGSCTFAMAFKVDHGGYGAVPLDGLGFIVLGRTPEAMGKGNWSVGVIADERASAAQRDAITAIASGAAGGPMAVSVRSGWQVPGRRSGADPFRAAAASPGPSRPRSSSTWRRRARWASILRPPSPCTSTARDIPPTIDSGSTMR